MDFIKYYVTSSNKLNDIPEEVGNLIICEDERCIYFDGQNGRISYQQIITLPTEDVRRNINGIDGAFYFIVSTKSLWNYKDDEWIKISSSEPQIIFDAIEDFPIVGDSEKLYVAQNQIYRYYAGSYHLCNNDSVWENI